MSLVIVETETASAALPFKLEIVWHLLAGHVSLTAENRSQERNLSAESPVPDFARQPRRGVRRSSQCQ